MEPFSSDAVRTLPGHGWLTERRVAARAALDEFGPPSSDDEAWRYSPIDALDPDTFVPVVAPGPAATAERSSVGLDDPTLQAALDRVLAGVADRAALVLLVDGWPVLVEPGSADAAVGLRVVKGSDLPERPVVLDHAVGDHVDVFGARNAAFASDVVVVETEPGATVTGPVVIVDVAATGGAATFSRVLVHAGAASTMTVVEWQLGVDEAVLCTPVTELVADTDARIAFVQVQERGSGAWQVGHVAARADDGARIEVALAGLGGHYARVRTDGALVGRGASATLSAVSFGERDQVLDYRTFQVHDAPDTTSTLLFKGALDGASRSVYTGTIRISKLARRSNAFQTNRNLKLSDGAWADSVPNLEIEHNDVRCSHASTISPIDPEQRFYLESRGVPTAIAERLVVAGFFDEVLDAVPVAAVAALVREEIGRRLDRRVRGAEVRA